MRTSPLVLAGVGALVAAATAAAVVNDPNDATGRLDIRKAGVTAAGDVVEHGITTYTRWPSRFLRDAGPKRFICVYVWTGDERPQPGRQDYQMCASYEDGRLKGRITRIANGKTTAVAVRRGGRRRIEFDLPVQDLGINSYHWLAVTRDGGTGSFDIAPNNGPALHR